MRNTICATLTAITLTLCTALAGCGSASEPSTPAHAVRSVDSQCSAGADVFTECVITLTTRGKWTASSTRRTASRPACHATGAM